MLDTLQEGLVHWYKKNEMHSKTIAKLTEGGWT